MIEKLTEYQESQLAVYRERWIKIGLSTEPLDRAGAKAAARKCYEAAGLTPPKKFLYATSPYEAAHMVKGRSPAEARSDMIFGSQDAGWLSFYAYCLEVLKLDCCKPLEGLIEMAHVCGWWAPYEELCVLQDRPKLIVRDEEGQLHCEDGKAVEYRDGWGVYAIHGVRMPKWVVEEPEKITVKNIRDEENAEIRRIMRERYGDGRYLVDIGAKVIDSDSVAVDALVPGAECIQRCLMEDDDGRRFLVASDGSTDRVYFMQVPSDIKTCGDAYKALSGGMEDSKCVIQT